MILPEDASIEELCSISMGLLLKGIHRGGSFGKQT
jgi:hypothetical protein